MLINKFYVSFASQLFKFIFNKKLENNLVKNTFNFNN